jgi:tripartite-type tricarboxylate transporter receptor subunit TctC
MSRDIQAHALQRRHLMQAGLAALAAPGMLLHTDAALAQTWPSKPIKFIVPYPPGGPTDIMARIIAPRLQTALGQPVVVDNISGAGGNVGTDRVAKGPADGYQILLAASGPMAVNKTLYKGLPYDPVKDLAPITQISSFPLVLEVHPSLPVNNLKEFIEYVKKNPGRLSFASAGSGTPQHLAGELFKTMTGTFMTHIPYRGAGPAINDVIGGQVPVMFDILAGSLPHIKSGRMKPLAVTTASKTPALPDLPTIGEVVKGYEITAWHGIAVAANTPDAIVQRFNAELLKIFQDKDVRQRWADIGSLVVADTPAKFGALIKSEGTRLADVVKRSGATPD